MTRKRKVRTTIDPGRELEVDQAEYSRLKEQGLLLPDGVPVWVASTRVDGGRGKAVALRAGQPMGAALPTHDIQTTMRPDLTITVSDDEYMQLLAAGLVYSGSPVAPVADGNDLLFADKIQHGSATPAALKAAFGPSAALRSWRTALGGRAYAPADIVVMGDSIGEGQGATARSRRWSDEAIAELRTRYPAGVTGGAGYVPACNYQTSYPSDWAITGGAAGIYGLGERSVQLTGTGHRISTTQKCTSFRIYYIQGATNTGPFTVTIDGGAPTTVTPPTTGGYGVGVWSSAALTSGSHSIVVGYGGTQTSFILGGFFFDGDETAGIRLVDATHYGYYTDQYAADFANAGVPGNNFQVGHYLQLPAGPSLVVLALGLNDYQAGTAPSTVQAHVETVIATIKALHSSQGWFPPSFLLLAMYQRTDVTSPAHPWAEYVAAYRAIANADPTNVACLSFTDRIDTAAQAFGILQSDGTHPTDKGHGFIADAVTVQLSAT